MENSLRIPTEKSLAIVGVITLELRDADGAVADRRESHNIITTAGLAALSQAINWSGIQDVANSIGLTAQQYSLAPLYGAVGTGTSAPSAADTALGTEVARATVAQGSGTNGQASWSFFFGNNQAVGSISEAGAFAGASLVPGSGTLVDHVKITPPVNKTNTQTMTMQVSFSLVNG